MKRCRDAELPRGCLYAAENLSTNVTSDAESLHFENDLLFGSDKSIQLAFSPGFHGQTDEFGNSEIATARKKELLNMTT